MADRFLARAMGTLLAVDAPALPAGAMEYIASRVVDCEADGAEVHATRLDPLPREAVPDALRRLARALTATLAPEFPALFWLPFTAAVVRETGVVIVRDADRPAGDPYDVVGIDAEGGLDPLLCMAAELLPSGDGAWSEPSTPLPLWSRVSRVIVAQRVEQEAQTSIEVMPHRHAAEHLLAGRGTPPRLPDALDAVVSLLVATGGAVRVRYTKRLDLRDVLRAIDALPHGGSVPSAAAPRAIHVSPSTAMVTSLEGAPRWYCADGAVWTSSSDRSALLDTADTIAAPIVLEESAHVIWKVMIEQPGSTSSQIAQRVAGVYDVDVEQVRASVDELLRELRDRRLAVDR